MVGGNEEVPPEPRDEGVQRRQVGLGLHERWGRAEEGLDFDVDFAAKVSVRRASGGGRELFEEAPDARGDVVGEKKFRHTRGSVHGARDKCTGGEIVVVAVDGKGGGEGALADGWRTAVSLFEVKGP